MTHCGIEQYRRVNTCGDVESANPHKLIDLLYGGLKTALNGVARAIDSGRLDDKVRTLNNALDILQTLQVSLDPQSGGKIADSLDRLYSYMERRLTEVNLHNDSKAIEELLALTDSLRAAWETIPEDQRAGPKAA